jgi:tuberculosinol/isotuberculosinol synthase
MELESFLQLSADEVASLVRGSGPKVCVFPINGTRRWFTLEYGHRKWDDPITAYMDLAGQNHIGLYRLFFDHGIDTLLTPAFGPDILLRSDEYVKRIGVDGLARLAEHPAFLDFYDAYDVRVHFYGDHRRILGGTEFAHLSDLFDAAAERTRSHQHFRLLFGVFANDATQTVAEFSSHYFRNHGRVPEKRELIEMYYGEYVAPVDLFIGFDRFSAFDMPLLATGEEDLYFTVSPSPYMDQGQLRRILYDHMYMRRSPEPEYADLSPEELQDLRNFYTKHREYTLGTGKLLHGIWTPELYT